MRDTFINILSISLALLLTPIALAILTIFIFITIILIAICSPILFFIIWFALYVEIGITLEDKISNIS